MTFAPREASSLNAELAAVRVRNSAVRPPGFDHLAERTICLAARRWKSGLPVPDVRAIFSKSRDTAPNKRIDDLTFPVRIKFVVPPCALG